jgi:HAD superfamily hydrolase (TIGR01509 family)
LAATFDKRLDVTVRKTALALLFDLDGTMVDTDALHLQAYNSLLGPLGRVMDLAYYKAHVMGFANGEIMREMFPDRDEAHHAAFIAAKEAAFRGLLGRLEPLPGLLDLLDWADNQGCARAVVTNAPRENASLMLRGLGLAERFPIVVLGDELAHGKPHPLAYETALQRTGTAAENALAFEDSLSGVRSASAAGIHTVGMTTGLSEAALRAAGAKSVAADFRDAGLLRLIYAKAA